LFAAPAILVGIAMCIWLRDPAKTRRSEHAEPSSFWRDSGAAIGDRNLRWILIAAIVAAGGSGHGIITSFLPLYLNHELGMGATAVGVVFTAMNIGSVAGPMISGRLADRYPSHRILLASYAASAVVTLMLPWLGANFIAVTAAAAMLGIFAFGTNPILQTLVAQTTSDQLRDTGFAWFYTATFLAGALWSPAVGYLSEWLGLKAAFGAMAASFIAAIVCVLRGRLHEVSAIERRPAEAVQHG
jgi:predicted MFS family arabinose efflux permease